MKWDAATRKCYWYVEVKLLGGGVVDPVPQQEWEESCACEEAMVFPTYESEKKCDPSGE
jgi:hypothetical protein